MTKVRPAGLALVLLGFLLCGNLWPAQRMIDRFPFEANDLALHRAARPQTYFDKTGRTFAILGTESGSFEAWAYPLKILRNFELSFFIGSSTQPIPGREVVRFIEVTPAVTTLTYVYQSFTVKASFVASVREPGAVILLAVEAVEPLTIVCGFLPVLQPMWPAGIGGQYAYWDDGLKAYLISEPRRLNHGFVGSPAGEGISYTPAHMLADTPSEFKIAVADPKAARGKFISIIVAGGKGDRAAVQKVYQKIEADPRAVYREAEEHYRNLRADTMRVSTPVKDFDLAFEWGKVAYDNLFVDNPDLGPGMVAGLGPSGTGGRPGFGWFFGTDTFFNSLSMNGYGAFSSTKTALSFLRRRQRQDGKIMHELSQAAGYVDWFKDYPYGYIHGDTTPYYIEAVYDYVRSSGDLGFLQESWPSVKKAFDYCLGTDANGDGLMDNRKAGLGALEFGSLTGIETDIYLGAVWVQACRAMERLASAVGDKASAAKADQSSCKAVQAYEDKFWDEASGHYSYAFNADGRRVPEITPWSAVGLMWELGMPDRSRKTLERLNRADMTTDWGIRMMSTESSFYEPLNYNYGACWPFLTGYVAAALYQNSQPLQGFEMLQAAARHTFDNGLGCVTELFSGNQNIWPQEAVAHQGFSSGGLVLPFIRGLLGLEGDALEKEVIFKPRLPGDWPGITVENFRVGEKSIGLKLERNSDRLKLQVSGPGLEGWKINFSPLLAGCGRLRKAKLDGREIVLASGPAEYPFQPRVTFSLTGSNILELELEPAVDVLAPDNPSLTGDMNQGLKIVSVAKSGKKLTLAVEGLAGRTYVLPLLNPELASSTSGAELDGRLLKVSFPAGNEGAFVRREVTILQK